MLLQKTIFLFIFFIFLSNSLKAAQIRDLGEHNFNEYAPVNHLFLQSDSRSGRSYVLSDSTLESGYVYRLFQNELMELNSFFGKELGLSLGCTRESIDNNYDFYRFLYRALTISYLYEDNILLNDYSTKLNLKNKCQVDFSQVLKACSPRSIDMKNFLGNLDPFYQKDKPIIDASHSLKEYEKNFLKNFRDKNDSFLNDRFEHFCKTQNCNGISLKTLKRAISNECDQNIEDLLLICNERDSLFGMSQINEATFLISRSEVLNYNLDENHRVCLTRFSQYNYQKEKGVYRLSSLYKSLFRKKRRERSPLLLGNLFKAANLKIFSDKGLTNVIVAHTPEKRTTEVVKEIPIVKETPKISVNEPKEPPVRIARPVIKKEDPKPKVEYIGAFQFAVKSLREFNLEATKVDMVKFHYDFIFSPEVVSILEDNLEQYMSMKALEEMKKFDSLGEIKGPIPLSFIKFMIEEEKHKGMYNLTTVVGDRFYVVDDLDEKSGNEPQLINLKNDLSTDYIWQITVLK